ncbi:MAG TPA: oxalate:formate antiporter [Bdellovibrionota bacterium]|nr:oxalate:formate antiporter [Bdellovibrionota bacterium]
MALPSPWIFTYWSPMSLDLPREHRQFIDRALPLLKGEPRVLGVAAAGSWIAQGLDEFSDIDLIVVAFDADRDSLTADRFKLAESLGKPLSIFTGEHVGEPRLLICLYDEPLIHVDLKFLGLSEFFHRIENPVVLFERGGELTAAIRASKPNHPMPDLQWIEDRFWVWIHYSALRLGRGELLEVLDCLAFMRARVLGPLALVRKGQLPRGVRRIEQLVPEALGAFDSTLASRDRESCGRAIEGALEFYRELRNEMASPGLILRSEAEKRSVEYLARVRAP